MARDDYQLLSPRSSGRDGSAFQALGPDGTAVVFCALDGAHTDESRWRFLRRRLPLVALMEGPGTVRLIEHGLDAEPPFVVVEESPIRTLEQYIGSTLPLAVPEAVALGRELASLLGDAHRLGLVHGDLRPDTVLVALDGRLKLDYTGLLLRPPAGPDSGPQAAAFRPPELGEGEAAIDSSVDVYSLGSVLRWLLTGQPGRPYLSTEGNATGAGVGDALSQLLHEMLAADADARPSARTVVARLDGLNASTNGAALGQGMTRVEAGVSLVTAAPDAFLGGRLGRFDLVAKLGEGGMGAVYRGLDPTDGRSVAIKVVRAVLAATPQALRRFHKEARLLAQVKSPYVANLIEFNEDNGVRYLVTEFVAGKSLRSYLAEHGKLEEKEALGFVADVARGLRGAHERGIVHRDVKPENVILPDANAENAGPRVRARLLDFGLAREIVQSESQQMTKAESPLGTPLYMAPEQCTNTGTISPATDIYSLGVTLFHLLAGRPPFQADEALGTLLMHCTDPVPPLRQFNENVSEAACEIINKALAKEPRDRYPDGAALLEDLERVLRGEPTRLTVHPERPAADPAKVMRFAWTWELTASPAQLWPHVSNTERLNRAAGLPAVDFTTEPDPGGGTRRFAETRKAGVVNSWREHPFEWVEGRRLGVLREFNRGVFRWLVSTVDLVPRPGGGTTLTHRVEVEPVGLFGKLIGKIEIGIRTRKSLERVYKRIDAALVSRDGARDPFEAPAPLTGRRRRRLETHLQQLITDGVDAGLAERLGEFFTSAPDQEVARIRPLALAKRLGVEGSSLVEACLRGVHRGLLVLLWDVLCPMCRIPTQAQDTLRQLQEHAHCEACNLDFQLDFARSVEMIFRVHPEVRASELRTYCAGGPAHSSHVVSQVRVPAGKRTELSLDLAEGAYRLRGPQLPFTFNFQVGPAGLAERADLELMIGPADLPQLFRSGSPTFVLTNDSDRELVVRVERTAPRQDALTAARASALPLFRSLFPGEILAPGQLVSVSTISFLVTRLDGFDALARQQGEAVAFAAVHDHLLRLEEKARAAGGALVKAVGSDGALLAFDDPVDAVRLVLDFQAAGAVQGLQLAAGVQRGAARVATLDGRLDYFGSVVREAADFARTAHGGELVLGPLVAADAQVEAILRQRRLHLTTVRGPAVRVTSEPPRQTGPAAAEQLPFHRVLVANPAVDGPEVAPLRGELLESLASFCRELTGPGNDRKAALRRADDFLRLAAAARLSSPENALAFYRQAQAILAPLAAEPEADQECLNALARCYNNLADVYRATGQTAQAMTALRHALTTYGRRLGGPTGPLLSIFGVGAVCFNLGILSEKAPDGSARGWYDRAVQALQQVPAEALEYRQAQAFLRNAEGRRKALGHPTAKPVPKASV